MMVRVTEYTHDERVRFKCDKCEFMGEYDVGSSLKDNCVLDVEVVCSLCGDMTVLYVLKCKDELKAKLLNAELKALKIRRQMEENANGN